MRIYVSLMRAALCAALFLGLFAPSALAQSNCPNNGALPPSWSTSQGGTARDSVNTDETCLTHASLTRPPGTITSWSVRETGGSRSTAAAATR